MSYAQTSSPSYQYIGYNGNQTIYMTSGAPCTFLKGFTSPTKPYYWNQVNALHQPMHTEGTMGMAISQYAQNNYSFGENYNKRTNHLSVVIPIAVSGFTRTTNITVKCSSEGLFPLIWGSQISAELHGLVNNSQNLEMNIIKYWNTGMNVTGDPVNQIKDCPFPVLVSSAALAWAIMLAVPGLDIPAALGLAVTVALGTLDISDSELSAGSVAASPSTGITNNVDSLLSQEFYVNNGTRNLSRSNFDGCPTVDCMFESNYSAQEILRLCLGSSEFSHSGSLQLNGSSMFYSCNMNLVQGCKGSNVSSTGLNIPLLPSEYLTGLACINNNPAPFQEVKLTSCNNQTSYIVYTNASGGYGFYAKPGLNYKVQDVFPGGQVSSSSTMTPTMPSSEGTCSGQDIDVFTTSVSGRVDNSIAKPISNIPVTITGPSYSETVLTDSTGEYQFNYVDVAGSYQVSASYGGGTYSASIQVDSSSLGSGPPPLPSDPVEYIPVSVYNNQSIISGSFDLKVSVDSEIYSSWEAPYLQNVEWFSSDGAIIPSWIEAGNSNSAQQTIYWLLISGGLKQEKTTVYMGFMPTSINLFNASGPEGEAPQLSSSYAQYDNGASVFPGYWNFAGNSMPTGWHAHSTDDFSDSRVSINNGLSIKYSSGDWYASGIGTNSSSDYSQYSLYAYAQTTSWSSINIRSGEVLNYSGTVQDWGGDNNVFTGYSSVLGGNSFDLTYQDGHASGTIASYTITPTANQWYLMEDSWPSTGMQFASLASPAGSDLSNLSATNHTASLSHTFLWIGMWDNNGGGGTVNYQYAFLAYNTPGNIMPSSYESQSIPETGPNITVPTYSISFSEGGLHGQTWSVTINGVTKSSTGNIVFYESSYDTYTYSVGSVTGYSASPSSGSQYLGTSNVSVSITYSPTSTYTVTFSEGGLPSGSTWEASLNGNSKSASAGSDISYSEPDGSFSFNAYITAYGGTAYYPTPSSGTLTIEGSNVQKGISYRVFASVNGSTLIQLSNGTYETAQNITVGTSLMTYNTSTDKLQTETVLQVFSDSHSNAIIVDGFLNVSSNQEIWTTNGWVQAHNLTLGDKMLDPLTGHYMRVWSLKTETGHFTMYGFEVSVDHDYIAYQFLLYEI